MKNILQTTVLLYSLIVSITTTYGQFTYIEDNLFHDLLISQGIDSTGGEVLGQMLTSDAEATTYLHLNEAPFPTFPIHSLVGLEDFINLEYFGCFGIELEDGNVSFTTLTQLQTIIFYNSGQSSLDFSQNVQLETLVLTNYLAGMGYPHTFVDLDLSNNSNLTSLRVENNINLQRINLKNHQADTLSVILTFPVDSPAYQQMQTVCIEVDNPEDATMGLAPYDQWSIQGDHYFSDKCILSVQNQVHQNFKVYPNPVEDFISIGEQSTDLFPIQGFQLLDITGKYIKSFDRDTRRLDVRDLSSGSYLLIIQTAKGNTTRKVIKK